jgi:hypothetical protein
MRFSIHRYAKAVKGQLYPWRQTPVYLIVVQKVREVGKECPLRAEPFHELKGLLHVHMGGVGLIPDYSED